MLFLELFYTFFIIGVFGFGGGYGPMQTMAIGDVRPQEPQEQDQPSSSTLVHPPTQDGEQVPQEEGQDQGGAHEEHDKEEEASRAPPTQVRTMIQRNHPCRLITFHSRGSFFIIL